MEPRMKHQIFLTLGCAALLFATTSTPLLAQDSQNAESPQPTAKASSSTPKKHKVWTDDEVSTLRTPEDNYVDQKQAAEAAAAAAAATAAQQAKVKPKSEKHVGAAPALSNPKSAEDADRMIAWENRDVDAQQNLAKQTGILEQIKKERDALMAQKKEFEKKAGSETKPVDSASTSTPQ
jgi:hypothetical protein